jgi:hypothetical protein
MLKSTALLRNLSPERIQLTACGLLTVGKHLIPAVDDANIIFQVYFKVT